MSTLFLHLSISFMYKMPGQSVCHPHKDEPLLRKLNSEVKAPELKLAQTRDWQCMDLASGILGNY